MLLSLVLSLLLLGITPSAPSAIENPVNVPNNRFGIHITDESDLARASQIVNSSGGEWGYITFVIREDEMDVSRYNNFFDQLKTLNLIPIVRLATTQNSGTWNRPDIGKATKWADFLNKLQWPTKNRYVILFNEPNHAKEWGGSLNPAEYARISRRYWEELKKASPDFFVMPAALDLSAPNSPTTMDAVDYWQQMYESDDLIFTIFDGLNSHSYPNPGFCGSPSDTGRQSIQGYKWELRELAKYDIQPDTPIMITETGWACPSTDLINNYKKAFNEVWTDKNLIAVTPFLLSYQAKPFADFSWIDPRTGDFRSFVQSIIDISKTKGEPAVSQDESQINQFLAQTYKDYSNKFFSYVYIVNAYEDAVFNN
jgi:hypothetical protein